MKTRVLALALLVAAAPASATVTKGDHAFTFALGLGAGGSSGGGAFDFDIHERYDARFAHFFTPSLAVEGMLTQSDVEGVLSSRDGSMTQGFGSVLWSFRKDKRVRPYFVGGVGYQSVSSLSSADDGPAFQAGFGSFFFFTRKSPAALRLEWSGTWGEVSAGNLALGLTFRIRPKRAEAAPPPPGP